MYGSVSKSAMEMKEMLRISLSYNGPGVQAGVVSLPPRRKMLTAGESTRLCGLVTAYRLVDVIALLEGEATYSPAIIRQPLHQGDRNLHVSLTICLYVLHLECDSGNGQAF